VEFYLDIIQKAIDYNINELEENSDDYTMSEIFYMRGYTQSLKDVLEDLKNYNNGNKNQIYTLRKFNLN
tara:strand:- start:220 stop:426 length:207 start_codon:yes stop_codon:yes gene_type:complete